MPRVSRQQTELNREIITDTASQLFREQGFKSITVAEVMSASGLTHGGFYGHFDSKEALAAEACRHAFAQSAVTWKGKVAAHRKKAKAHKAIVDHYLSRQSRDKRGDACPAASFSGDMAREDDPSALRDAYLSGLHTLIETFAGTIDSGAGEAADREAALVQYALMVGAMTLARASAGTPLSNQLLDAAQALLNKAS